jgi:hypothetical protein
VSTEQQPILDRDAHDKLQAIMRRRDVKAIFDPACRAADPELKRLYGRALELMLFAYGVGFPAPEPEEVEVDLIEAPMAA